MLLFVLNPAACNFVKNGPSHRYFCFLKACCKWTNEQNLILICYWFPFGNKDGTESSLSIYFKLPPRSCCFSSWLSSNGSSVKMIRTHIKSFRWDWFGDCCYPWISSISSLLVWYFTIGSIFVQSWLIWTTFHRTSNYFCFIEGSLC